MGGEGVFLMEFCPILPYSAPHSYRPRPGLFIYVCGVRGSLCGAIYTGSIGRSSQWSKWSNMLLEMIPDVFSHIMSNRWHRRGGTIIGTAGDSGNRVYIPLGMGVPHSYRPRPGLFIFVFVVSLFVFVMPTCRGMTPGGLQDCY